MTCPNCGEEKHPEGADYCQQCGTRLNVGTETSTGLEQNLAAILSYALGWFSGIIFLIVEKKNDFVRFHAMQSLVAFGLLSVAAVVLNYVALIPYIGILFRIAFWIGIVLMVGLWLLLLIKASQGDRFRVPWAGDFAQMHMPGGGAAVSGGREVSQS